MIRKITLMFLLSALLVMPLQAQDSEANPLLRLLALIPNSPDARQTMISYADYRALESIRGIDTPTKQDFDDRTDLGGQWIAATMGLSGGMPLQNLFLFFEDMPDLVGFSFFDIDRTMVFGEPPSMGNILEGDFDAERIGAALSARDFTENDFDGVPVWCGANGCENGVETDLANRNPGNPFGGDLGRSEPVGVVSDSLLVNSASDGVVRTLINTYQGEFRSLADTDDYAAIAEALADTGTIAQALFLNPQELSLSDPAILLGANASPEQIEAIREQLLTDEPNKLAPYSAIAFADVGTENEQLAVIALAYADAENAEAAAQEVTTRLENFTSFRTRQPFSDVLENASATIREPAVYISENGSAVALIAVSYPLPSNEPQEGGARYQSSGLLYRYFISEVYSRSFYIVGTDFE